MPPGAGNPDPTIPIRPVGPSGAAGGFGSADPTVAVPVATGGGPGSGGGSGGPGSGGGSGGPGSGGGSGGPGDETDNRKWWWILGVIIAAIIIVVIVVLLSGGDSKKSSPSTTTTSSSTTTSTAPKVSTTAGTTTTTAAAAPQILQFTASPNPVTCSGGVPTTTVTLTWSSQSADSATVSIDNPSSSVGTYGPSGQQQFTFSCSASPLQHTYYLKVTGSGGQTAQNSILVTGNTSP